MQSCKTKVGKLFRLESVIFDQALLKCQVYVLGCNYILRFFINKWNICQRIIYGVNSTRADPSGRAV